MGAVLTDAEFGALFDAASVTATGDLAIVPIDARLPHMIWNGFWIFDEAVVLVETVSSELSLRDVDDVEIYTRFFESLWQSPTARTALSPCCAA